MTKRTESLAAATKRKAAIAHDATPPKTSSKGKKVKAAAAVDSEPAPVKAAEPVHPPPVVPPKADGDAIMDLTEDESLHTFALREPPRPALRESIAPLAPSWV